MRISDWSSDVCSSDLLTQDGRSLIMSDGTAQLRFLDPEGLTEERRITVTWNGRPVERRNELEYVKGEIWANIWSETHIVRVDPRTGAEIGRAWCRESECQSV